MAAEDPLKKLSEYLFAGNSKEEREKLLDLYETCFQALRDSARAVINAQGSKQPLRAVRQAFRAAQQAFMEFFLTQNPNDRYHYRHRKIALAFLLLGLLLTLAGISFWIALGHFNAFNIAKDMLQHLVIPVLRAACIGGGLIFIGGVLGMRAHRVVLSRSFFRATKIAAINLRKDLDRSLISP